MALAFIASAFNGQCSANQQQNRPEATGTTVATVGSSKVTSMMVEQRSDIQRGQFQQLESIPPEIEGSLYAGVFDRLLEEAYILELARREQVAPTLDSAPQAIGSLFQQQLKSTRMQLELTGKLKPGASDKELSDVLKKEAGLTLEEARTQLETEFKKALEDPARRDQVFTQLSQPALIEKYRRGIQVSEADLKRSFDTLTFKRILFTGKRMVDAAASVQKAQADLTAGMPFEKTMDKHSTESPAAGKKRVSENIVTLQRRFVDSIPAYATLVNLKPGETSQAIELPEGVAIYKLISVKNEVPKDFSAKQGEYREAMMNERAASKMEAEIKKLKETVKPQWSSDAFKALSEYNYLTTNPEAPTGAERNTKLQDVAKLAASATLASEFLGPKVAGLVQYLAIDTVYNSVPQDQKKSFADERIASILAVLKFTESPSMRVMLVDLYAEQKKGPEASEQLLMAAQSNRSMTTTGQGLHNDIAGKLEMLKKQNLIPADMAQTAEEELKRWRIDKREQEKYEAEETKRMKAEQARLEAEAKKNAAKPVDRKDATKAKSGG